MRDKSGIFLALAAFALLSTCASLSARAGIVVDNVIVTPVEDPHYNVWFDIVIQDNTLLTFGDSLTIGAAPYIDPLTGANLQFLLTPFDGPWAGMFVATILPAPNKNSFKFTYVGTSPFENNTGLPIHISTDTFGLSFGIFTIDMGPLTPELAEQLTQTLTTVSSTTDPDGGIPKILTYGSVTPRFSAVPEPSTLALAASLVPVGLCWMARRKRSAAA